MGAATAPPLLRALGKRLGKRLPMALPLAQLRGVTPSEGWPDERRGEAAAEESEAAPFCSATAWARFEHLATW